jgi:hypothetical protein
MRSMVRLHHPIASGVLAILSHNDLPVGWENSPSCVSLVSVMPRQLTWTKARRNFRGEVQLLVLVMKDMGNMLRKGDGSNQQRHRVHKVRATVLGAARGEYLSSRIPARPVQLQDEPVSRISTNLPCPDCSQSS